MRLVSSDTWLKVSLFSFMRAVIFLLACMTVVWSRPKAWPIFGSDRSVSSRHRYMAIWRASTTVWERSEEDICSMVIPK